MGGSVDGLAGSGLGGSDVGSADFAAGSAQATLTIKIQIRIINSFVILVIATSTGSKKPRLETERSRSWIRLCYYLISRLLHWSLEWYRFFNAIPFQQILAATSHFPIN